MDKPALTKDDRELFHYNPNTDDIIERVKAYGEAMAAWGAAQEREKAADLLESAEAEPHATSRLVNARRAYRAHQGD